MPCLRDQCGALDGDAFGKQNNVARANTLRSDQVLGCHFPEHLSYQYDVVEPVRDLGMAAAEGDVKSCARVAQLAENGLNGGNVGAARREEGGAQWPAGIAPVVAISLAFTFTRYQADSPVAKVMGWSSTR